MSCRDNPLPDTPYKGLMPYSEEDAPFFFGREGEREIITANLLASRLTLLYGASGVGKSSVLRAGVAYHLRQVAQQNLAERGTPEFAVVVFSSWRDDPIVGLADRVRDSVAQTLEARFLRETGLLDPTSRALAQTLQAWTERVGGDLLITLDQFEEYFLYHPQEDGEGTFAVEFPRAVNRPDLRVSFLISIREDSLAKLDRFKGRMPNLFDNYLRIEHLDREAARAAIEKPIEQYNRLYAAEGQVSIEPKLVEAVLRDPALLAGKVVLGEAGRGVVGGGLAPTQIETPYLQLVMTRLWEEERRAGSRTLRLETLDRLGGAESIVQTHLDATMRALSANEQDDAARVFHFLVTPSGTKIAHTVRDLAHYSRVSEDELGPVLSKLSEPDVRILRPIAPPPDQPQVPRYEIFHDVLAPAALDWRARYVQAQERAEAEKQLARERRRVTRLRLGVVGLLFVLLVVIGLAIFAIQQRDAAEQALAIVEQQDRAVPYFKAVMRGHTGNVSSASFSPDGKWVVTAGDNTARVWEATTGKNVATLRGTIPYSYVDIARFSPDGKFLVTAGATTAKVWETSTWRSVAQMRAPFPTRIWSAAFSPDGEFVVTATGTGGVRELDSIAQIWEAKTGRLVAQLRESAIRNRVKGQFSYVRSAAFSPDGKWVVTAGDDPLAVVWEATTGKIVSELRGDKGAILHATFSPDGRFVVTAGGTPRIWEASTGKMVAELKGHSAAVVKALFSPDGRFVVTASWDETARVWDAITGQSLAELRGHTREVNSVAFSHDGKFVLTASADGTARVWSVSTGKTLAELRGHTREVNSAEFSPDGKWVVTASDDATARIWIASTWSSVAELRGPGDYMGSAEFSPDAKFVVIAYEDTTQVWEAKTGQRVAELQGRMLASNPDGKWLVTAGEPNLAWLWEAATGKRVATLQGHTREVISAAYSPDGKFVVTADDGGAARVWEAATGQGVAELRGHADSIPSVGFNPDGKWLVTASWDKTARVWELSTGRSVAELRGHEGVLRSAAFSPDGKWVFTVGGCDKSYRCDGTVRVWEAETWRNVAVLQMPLDTIPTFSPDGKFVLIERVQSNWEWIREIWQVITGKTEGKAEVWQVATGQKVAKLRFPTAKMKSAAFSPDGKFLVTTGDCAFPVLDCDEAARVWEVVTGRSVVELHGHTRQVNSGAFSPDGKRIVTASDDGTARVWEVDTGLTIAELRGHTNSVMNAVFNGDDRFILTMSLDGTVRVWEASTR